MPKIVGKTFMFLILSFCSTATPVLASPGWFKRHFCCCRYFVYPEDITITMDEEPSQAFMETTQADKHMLALAPLTPEEQSQLAAPNNFLYYLLNPRAQAYATPHQKIFFYPEDIPTESFLAKKRKIITCILINDTIEVEITKQTTVTIARGKFIATLNLLTESEVIGLAKALRHIKKCNEIPADTHMIIMLGSIELPLKILLKDIDIRIYSTNKQHFD